MEIGIDASRLAVGKRTGTENYAFQVTRRLLEKANPDRTFTLYFNQPPTSLQLRGLNTAGDVKIKTMPFLRLWTHTRLSWELISHRPDVLFVPAHVLPLIHPVRSVVTVHDLGHLYHPEMHTKWARRYLKWSTPFSARSATRVIAVSAATRDDLIRYYKIDPAKIRVIYHGYEADHFQPVTDEDKLTHVRQKYNIHAGPYLFYVGTIQPRKNLVRLMNAFANLVRDESFDYAERNRLQLVIGGKAGWLSEPIVAEAKKLELGQQLSLVGYVADDDLPALMSGAEALMLPSLYEGFGLPVLEAMACGTPVICSNAGSLPEIGGDAVLYHDPLDTAEISHQMRRLLLSPELRANMQAIGFVQAAKFSWEKCATETLQVLEEAASP